MISHKHKAIFIHIPKTGGTSIEKFFNISPFNNKLPDYTNLVGYDKKLGIHLQHATVSQIIEHNLIPDNIWNEYFKFTIVRNPFDKMYSEYNWISKDIKIKDSFLNFINKAGKYREVLNNRSIWEYRGDHLTNQIDYIQHNNKIQVDYIARFENFQREIETILGFLKIDKKFDIHSKKIKDKIFKQYYHFYSRIDKKIIEKAYKEDLEFFDYFFDDKFSGLNIFDKLIIYKKRLFNK